MIEIPKDTVIDLYKNDSWQIWNFKDTNHTGQIKNHFYVMIPLTEDNFILACLITSQIEKREAFYSDKILRNCLVILDSNQLPFLKLKSLIDCNHPLFLSKQDFKKQIVDIEIKSSHIPKTLKNEIISKLKKSPAVKPLIKNSINRYL